MLGHELRNPLAAITNAGELTKLLDPAEPSFQETLEVIRQQASLMKRLVDDLLDVSRITSGRIQLQKSIVDVGGIVVRVAEANAALFTSRGHTLAPVQAAEDVFLEADPFRLEQILSNLLVNAAKYTDPGGEDLVQRRPGKRRVVFRVRDTGIGIGPDLLPNVFDLFAQANRSLHRAEGGLGIGLTIVRGLAELHGGRVWAESDGYGRGAEFCRLLAGIDRRSPRRPPVQQPATDSYRRPAAADPGRRRPASAVSRDRGAAEETGTRSAGGCRRPRGAAGGARIPPGGGAAGYRIAGNGWLRSGSLRAYGNGRNGTVCGRHDRL